MFERYTEKARRVIFYARYEASQYGSPYIDTEHLLLGLIRELKWLTARLLPAGSEESIRAQIAADGSQRKTTATSIDLPLSLAGKHVLAYGAEEADRLAHKHIGSEHLLLGLLREEGCFAARMLRERGLEISKLRLEFSKTAEESGPLRAYDIPARDSGAIQNTVEIHGVAWHASYLRKAVDRCREYSWHWHKCPWHPRDIVIDLKSGAFSFSLKLAEDSANFRLAKGGWTKDHCAVCRWELFESKDDLEHGVGYTNGRDWLCTECYEKFWKGPDFFLTTGSGTT